MSDMIDAIVVFSPQILVFLTSTSRWVALITMLASNRLRLAEMLVKWSTILHCNSVVLGSFLATATKRKPLLCCPNFSMYINRHSRGKFRYSSQKTLSVTLYLDSEEADANIVHPFI